MVSNVISYGMPAIDNNFGYDYLKDFEKRYEFKARDPVSTGWTEIDNIIKELDIDTILYETIPCLREIEILSKLVEEYKKEVWVSFTCNKDLEFRDGSSIIKACEILSSLENVSTIGVNCFSPLLAEKAIHAVRVIWGIMVPVDRWKCLVKKSSSAGPWATEDATA